MKSEQQFPIIETARLMLRKPLQEDANLLLMATQDEAVMKYYGMPAFKSQDEALGEIDWFNKIFDQAVGIRWVITERNAGQYIGDIGLHYVPTHYRAEIGFKLASAYWRKGIMIEALRPVLAFGFTGIQLNRIEAVLDPHNISCLGLLRKAGFTEEGLLREYELEEKGYVDLVMLSLLKKEYKVSSGN